MKEPTKLPFSYLGVYKLGEFREGFVTFESFCRNRAVEFTDTDAAWLFWYLNENREPGMSPVVLDHYPDGRVPYPGVFIPPGHPDHITKEQLELFEPGLSESELRENWFVTNLSTGTNDSEITFLVG